jgi:alcohol dehydrogenase
MATASATSCNLHQKFSPYASEHEFNPAPCPGGKERMRRLMNVLASGRVGLKSMVTHRFRLDQIEQAYELFANQRDGVLKVVITT